MSVTLINFLTSKMENNEKLGFCITAFNNICESNKMLITDIDVVVTPKMENMVITSLLIGLTVYSCMQYSFPGFYFPFEYTEGMFGDEIEKSKKKIINYIRSPEGENQIDYMYTGNDTDFYTIVEAYARITNRSVYVLHLDTIEQKTNMKKFCGIFNEDKFINNTTNIVLLVIDNFCEPVVLHLPHIEGKSMHKCNVSWFEMWHSYSCENA